MNTPTPPKLGNVIDVDPAWVAKVTEEALEPVLPIVDPHHHLWQRAGNDYMFHDLLADTKTGHNIVATVFVDCHSMYRKAGPAELRCVGETEFANGVAAMCASGLYGGLRACAAIVSHVDLRLGPRPARCSTPRSPPAMAASSASATRPASTRTPVSARPAPTRRPA